jgi:uncharacterized protein
MTGACAVIVMAKAPVAGYAKTRLIAALGADGAAALAERMIGHAIDQACGAALGTVMLAGAPDIGHPLFQRLAVARGVELAPQGDGDLGARMSRALALALKTHDRALLFGTDAPAVDAPMLRRAAALLADHDAVFIPAFDGGYVAVGLRRPAPELFAEMVWSTDRVMRDTRERLGRSGLRHAELAPVADIDEPADLAQLPPSWLGARIDHGSASGPNPTYRLHLE